MPDMYDKLGEMLNEALESGEIPQETIKTAPEPEVKCSQREHTENASDSGSDSIKSSFNKLNHRIFKKKKQIPTGEVIKLHKYTYNIHFSPQIQNALTTLDIVHPFTQKDITTAYHKKLKEVHPDTQNTIQYSHDVQNIRQISVDDIRNSYKILCDFFGIK
ncbi:hypothetical protein [Treponema bryantii]|uniref:hypothetical protein n=1 Tax=Treponema bryantii TaxID=163 RepID=UPI0030C7AE2D